MTEAREAFAKVVRERRTHRVFSADLPFDGEAVGRCLSLATLAANSSNLQLWEFYRVRSPDKLRLLATYCLGQKAARSAREMVVIVARRDLWRSRAKFVAEQLRMQFGPQLSSDQKNILAYYERLMPVVYTSDPLGILGAIKYIGVTIFGLFRPIFRELGEAKLDVVVHKSCALAAQTFMLGMKAEGYDTCPMEGFDSARVKRLLDLPRRVQINMVIAAGPAADAPLAPRIRVDESQVIFTV